MHFFRTPTIATTLILAAACGGPEAGTNLDVRTIEVRRSSPSARFDARARRDPASSLIRSGEDPGFRRLESGRPGPILVPAPRPETPAVPETPPAGPAPELPRGTLIEWRLEMMTLDRLAGMALIFRHPETDQIVRGSLRADGLHVEAIFDGHDSFSELPDVGAPISAVSGVRPMTLWAEALNAMVELQGCEIDLDLGRFHCALDGMAAPVASYTPSIRLEAEDVKERLVCFDHCPLPGHRPEAVQARHSSFAAPEDAAHEYALVADDGSSTPLLVFEEQPVLPETELGRIRSGRLYEATETRLDELRCDLDGDGERNETCVHAAVGRFFTWGVRAQDIQPMDGPAVVH